ncbi:hypothetical protein ACFOGJ_04805 [Marinibaculum pumilum]|uniref:DUF3761 domain-containing protein n=1 Tax=Marinibaculum pumilum TaxID=1766165 RepID=A0ABV7KW41_9PROT
MHILRYCLVVAVIALAAPTTTRASGACGTIASPTSCTFFGLPDPATAPARGTAATTAAAQVGGVVCRMGDGEPLVAGHAGSCERAGGKAETAGPGGLGPVIGYAPLTQYLPIFAAPSSRAAPAAGTPATVACTFGTVRLSAASVADCERAGGRVAPTGAE